MEQQAFAIASVKLVVAGASGIHRVSPAHAKMGRMLSQPPLVHPPGVRWIVGERGWSDIHRLETMPRSKECL
jgi:hypothetical protein